MQKFYMTFGSGQYFGALANSFIEIQASNEFAARMLMSRVFGAVWSGCYDEESFKGQVEQYGLTRLCIWDEHGNIIGR